MYYNMSRGVGCYPLSLYISWSCCNHHEGQIIIHHQNVRLEADVVCKSFTCELVGELIHVYHSDSYSVAHEERFVIIHIPCLTSIIVVMLLVNSNSEVRNRFRIVFIFFLKQSVDIVLAMNASMLTEPMQDWKTCWLSSLLIRKRSKWLLMVSNKLLRIKNMLCATHVLKFCRAFRYPTVI